MPALTVLLLLAPVPPARAGTWQAAPSGSMTAQDTSASGSGVRTDDMSFDLSTGLGLDFYTPADAGSPLDVQVLLLPCSYAFGGYQLPLTGTGTGFDSGDPFLNVFGASGNPCHEDSTASPTVTFTWVPDPYLSSDPPPKTAIVLEQAYAEATAYASGSAGDSGTFSGSGTADDGLGDPAVEVSSDPSSGTDKLSRGQRYTKQDGSSGKITMAGSPSATADSSSSDPGGLGNAVTALGYAATAYPVTIDPAGAVLNDHGDWNILIGQHCSPILQGIPSACTVTNYQWSVTGTTLQSWIVGTNSQGQVQGMTTYVSGPGPLTGPNAQTNTPPPSWYWDDLGDGKGKSTPETITCSATVTPPAGQGAAFPVSVSQPVTVWTPVWTCDGVGGSVQVGVPYWNTTSPPYNRSGNPCLFAGPIPGDPYQAGMYWIATVSPPPAPVSFGSGALSIVQLVTLEMTYTAGTAIYAWPTNGQEGLDDTSPYGWTSQPPSTPYYYGGDSPGLPLTDYSATAATLGDEFEDYLMYTAPGSSQPVPIGHFIWTTNGSASIPASGNWADFASNPAGTVTPSGYGSSGEGTPFLPQNSFPEWTQNNAITDNFWFYTNPPPTR